MTTNTASTSKNTDLEQARYAPVVYALEGTVFANSRDVAAYFEKRHDNVLRDIDNLITVAPILNKGASSNLRRPRHLSPCFEKVPYVDPQNGQTYRSFSMTRDGFTLLVMGFTGKTALGWKLSYIEAFNKMEAEISKTREQNEAQSAPRGGVRQGLDKSFITIAMDRQTAVDFMEGYAMLRRVGLKVDADLSFSMGVVEDIDFATFQISMVRRFIKEAMI